ncbi:PREDICTED: uncharacterized protein LOC108372817 [Rhagoletis zephyria]|uniref:uncharacterized protein LOC108372817 n=1 Tax=Rhagoletis zephyria TaxID=28612 RepID=UPI0008119891|nr:PREDICTED: uncharacterized protein LOC108372817 [Rhagoletis zephyria]
MWFVLQDKLLLSYASKEEYDNKLVSFKDVLNLVPGTMVRPLGGFRFTIETTTHVMYTFHCDDRNAYREWITMLLDSLSATVSTKVISATTTSSSPTAYSLLPLQQQRFRNISVDNIPHALWSNAAQNSQRQRELSSSCDSMRQRTEFMDGATEYAHLERIGNIKTVGGIKSAARSPLAPALSLPIHGSSSGGGGGSGAAVRLPIARSTAKILERNGVNSSGPTKKYQQQQQQQQHYQKRQQQQVNCCNRSSGTTVNATGSKSNNKNNHNNFGNNSNDNVTDARLTTEASATHFRLHGESHWSDFTTLDNGLHHSGTGSTTTSTSSSSSSHRPINQSVLKINSMFQKQPNSSLVSEQCVNTSHHNVVNKEFLLHPKPKQTNCDQSEFIPKHNHNNNSKIETNNCNNTLFVDCCSMNDDAQVVDNNVDGAYSCCAKDSKAMVMVKDQIQRMNIKGRKEMMSYTNAVTVDRRERKRVVIKKRLEEESIIERASMSKAIGGEECSGTVLDSNGENDVEVRPLALGKDAETTLSRSSEPIYAVVDLAHKYAQRQQRYGKNNLKNLDTNFCRSYESILQGVEPSIVAPIRGGSIEKSTSKLHVEDDIDGIYEDGDKFAECCKNGDMPDGEDDENIYEPVGFENFANPKINASATQPSALWRYITRLKVNSLLQFTRMRRNNHHVDYDTIDSPTPAISPTLTPNHRKTTTLTKKHHHQQPSTACTATTPTSQFANIKHKFGAHRKSMQVRVRKMCARTHEPKTTVSSRQPMQQPQITPNGHFSDVATNGIITGSTCVASASGGVGGGGAKKSKYRWKSVKIRPKHFNGATCSNSSSTTDDISNKTTTTRQSFFGSLPHLRKARVSLFSTPNLHAATTTKDQNSNVSGVGNKVAADLAHAGDKSK